MPKLTIDETRSVQVPPGKRLVNALTDEGKIDQLHSCGGAAKCTTCRVQFVDGEPGTMTQAEQEVLSQKGLLGKPGIRLSCQILCNDDMSVKAISLQSVPAVPRPVVANASAVKATNGTPISSTRGKCGRRDIRTYRQAGADT